MEHLLYSQFIPKNKDEQIGGAKNMLESFDTINSQRHLTKKDAELLVVSA